MRKYLLAASMLYLLLANCTKDKIHVETTLDRSLAQALDKASITNDKNHFILPESDDFATIPQDEAHNPLTKEKVRLGKLLFYETGIALSPTKNAGQKTYSCASCHVPSAGFRPGSVQGIADGGIGFGINGENRSRLAAYEEDEMDVQGVRPLSVLNVAFVENTTWNGRFGSTGVNIGTEDRWEIDSALHINEAGFAALESQNVEGLSLIHI